MGKSAVGECLAGKKSRCLLWGLAGSLYRPGGVAFSAEFSSCKHQLRAEIGEEADLVSTERKQAHSLIGKP